MKKIFTLFTMLTAGAFFFNASAQIGNYCTSGATSQYDTKIDKVELNTINVSTSQTNCELYTNNTAISTVLSKGASYTLKVTNGSCSGYHYTAYINAWIDFNQNNTFDANEQVMTAGPTSGLYGVYTSNVTIPATAATGNTFMRVVIRESTPPSACGSFTYGETEDYGIVISPSLPNDLGVASIDSPDVFCEGTHNIVATIRNFGSNQILSGIVNWKLGTQLQTPVAFSGILDTAGGTGSMEAQILLGSNLFGAGVPETITVWTSNPNGTTDPTSFNDTVIEVKQPSLSGNFTIDPLGSGSFNYLTLSDAVNDLNSFGVCGPVTFAVAGGTYSEQMTLGPIVGTSATNTITFEADTAGVIVEYGPSSTSDNWVLSMQGTQWVTIDGFTFQHSSGGSASYRTLVDFNGGSSNNTLMNNTFNYYNTTSSSSYLRGWSTTSGGNNYNHFMDNQFNSSGYYGFYFYGSSSSRNVGNEFDRNTWFGGYYYAMYFYYTQDTKFRNNTVMPNGSSSGTSYGPYFYYSYGATEITGNYIDWSYYGMRLYYCYGDQNNRALVANNKIHGGNGTTTAYGAYLYYCENMDFVHNTIWGESGPSSACYGAYAYYGSGNTFMNNVVYIPQGSSSYYGIYCPSSTAYNLDYNNVWTPTMNYGYYNGAQANLTSWKSQGVGMHSHAADPGYTKKDSMYTCLDTLDNAGTPVGVMTDYDLDDRNPTTPDIGADEFIGGDSSTFDAGPDGLLCNGAFIEIGVNVKNAQFIWNTLDTTGKIMVNTVGDYTVSVSSSCGGSFLDVVTVTDNTPNAAFTYSNSYFTGLFKDGSRANVDAWRWVMYDDPASKSNPMDTVWAKDHNYLFPDNGPYYVCLTTMNECDTIEICKTWGSSVGINESDLSDAISLIPNPVSDRLTVQFNNFSGDQINVEMTNVQGQVVYSDQFVNINGNGNRVINVSSLNKGMYIVKFTTENEVIAKQIIVQ